AVHILDHARAVQVDGRSGRPRSEDGVPARRGPADSRIMKARELSSSRRQRDRLARRRHEPGVSAFGACSVQPPWKSRAVCGIRHPGPGTRKTGRTREPAKHQHAVAEAEAIRPPYEAAGCSWRRSLTSRGKTLPEFVTFLAGSSRREE